MSYRGFLVAVPASHIKKIENMKADELGEYIAKSQGVTEGGGKPDFFALLSLLEKDYDMKSVNLGRWFPVFDQFCLMGKPLFNHPETQNIFSYFQPFVAGTEGIHYLQQVFEELMLSSDSLREQDHFREKFHGLLEIERTGNLFLIYGW